MKAKKRTLYLYCRPMCELDWPHPADILVELKADGSHVGGSWKKLDPYVYETGTPNDCADAAYDYFVADDGDAFCFGYGLSVFGAICRRKRWPIGRRNRWEPIPPEAFDDFDRAGADYLLSVLADVFGQSVWKQQKVLWRHVK